MRAPIGLSASLLFFAIASAAEAAIVYVAPNGKEEAACLREDPCDLATQAEKVVAGDTVILMDGTYKSRINVVNSGTDEAWITFQADDCATPIIEGTGIETETGDKTVDQPVGVGSAVATHLRFIGLVSRGWNSGFSNGWTGEGTTNSNGFFEYQYCIGDGNGRTGFTFFSAEGIRIQNSISSHNGTSKDHSWSSGITLYEAQGDSNLIEGNVSFENIDNQKHSDGNGFIVDESSNNVTLSNNIAFRNGGSCLRLTKSMGTRFINNTCYHDGQDLDASGPDDPGELYFTIDGPSVTDDVTFRNNILIATGTGPGENAVYNQPTSGWSNNVVAKGSVSHFVSPEGPNPDFTLASEAADLIGKGASGAGLPEKDIGFDPKCIARVPPTMLGNFPKQSWWQYSVDLDYIKCIGGVAKCFRPKERFQNMDIGAYAAGPVAAVSACHDNCKSSAGGTAATGGTSSISRGGSSSSNAGGSASSMASSAGGQTASSDVDNNPGSSSTNHAVPNNGGCSCNLRGSTKSTAAWIFLAVLGGHLPLRRRRSA